MKKSFIILGVVLMFTMVGCKKKDDLPSDNYNGRNIEFVNFNSHTLVHRADDLKLGVMNNVFLNEDYKLELVNNKLEGHYISPSINTGDFTELVASWNAVTEDKSHVELQIQVKINNTWTDWFTYGEWSFGKQNGSVNNQSDETVSMYIDTINIKNMSANGFKYKIILARENSDIISPLVHLIAVTMDITNAAVPAVDLTNLNWEQDNIVPVNSQMVASLDPRSICSPTSLTMLLRYYGFDYTPEEIAVKAKDYTRGIYGNWSFNVAVAGSLGLDAYVSRLSTIDELKVLIAKNIPVAVSITLKDQNQLEGAPMAYPYGHLLVVRGFVVHDGVEFVIVNDPAAPNNETVNREYRLDQFTNIWKNYVYIIED